MSSLGTSKGILEIAKFGVYVTVPIVLMYAFANNTKNLQKFMGNMEVFEDKRFPRQQLEMGFSETINILVTQSFNAQSSVLKCLSKHSYITFPSKIVRPPSPEEMRERARELGRRKDTH
ncbi:hypothetical protein DKX38_015442 [Salix brachista]|uniref:Uncharacterized protein n=1 Tax=Salix brachista TaxID=2182728 RepID=A0A5N5L584_9ROSI|nr:hypothetical protein DKX38_015442 [Salix brachista]